MQRANSEEAKQLRFQQFEASVVTFSAVISCCETASRWLEALEVLRCLPKSRLTGNCYTFNAAVSACEKGSCWLGAVWLLYEMKMAAWQLDMISYNAAISACSSSSQWRSILLLFAEMTLWELQKDVVRPVADGVLTAWGAVSFRFFDARCTVPPRLPHMKQPSGEWRGVTAVLKQLCFCMIWRRSIWKPSAEVCERHGQYAATGGQNQVSDCTVPRNTLASHQRTALRAFVRPCWG